MSQQSDREQELGARILAVSDGIFTAMGVADKRLAAPDLERRIDDSCAIDKGIERGYGDGQAWVVRRDFRLVQGEYDDDALFDKALVYLRAQGYDVVEYENVPPDGAREYRSRLATAVKGDLSVLLGARVVRVLVSVGPCADGITHVGKQFVRVP